jgi:hypothetical protein
MKTHISELSIALYTHQNCGVVKLFINDVLVAKKSYKAKKQRKQIMETWRKCFTNIQHYGKVYMQVFPYEKVYETKRIKNLGNLIKEII